MGKNLLCHLFLGSNLFFVSACSKPGDDDLADAPTTEAAKFWDYLLQFLGLGEKNSGLITPENAIQLISALDIFTFGKK